MGIVIAILAFGLMIAIHEFGHFIVAKLTGMIVTEFSIGMGPTLWKKRIGETKYALRALPIGGFVSVYGEDSLEAASSEKSAKKEACKDSDVEMMEYDPARSYENIAIWKRALFITAGAFMNFVLGFALILIMIAGTEVLPTTTVAHSEGVPELQAGDTLLSVNGYPIFEMMDFSMYTTFDADRHVDIEVRRDGQMIQLNNVDISEYEYIMPAGVKNSILASLNSAWRFTASSSAMVFYSLQMLFQGAVPVTEMSGPVGVTAIITEVVPYGWKLTVQLIALVSINLGIMNLLPIPALDGGHLLFLFIEKVFRKPVPRKIQAGLQMAVMCSLMLFLVFITGFDIYRWITGFFAASIAG